MPLDTLPPFPYGAVYYRRSNPPERDWARDYRTAAEDGLNAFRHWCMWGAVERAPGEFDWEGYDRQLDLAAANGMKTVIAEMVTSAPEWAFRRYAHARRQTADGRPLHSRMNASSATGGWPGLCLDHPEALAAAGRFLTELATRYRDHPGLGGYDVWNECNVAPCYCPATEERFRDWLREQYGDPRTLGEAWRRYSFTDWADVTIPRTPGPYPDTLDWLRFHLDNAYRLLRWRVDLIRGRDPDHAIVAHGIAATLTALAPGAADDWRAAAAVEAYGYTWGSARHGDEPWRQYHAVDLVRAAARGKPFWHAESYAGPLWLAPNVLDKPRDEGRIATPEDIRLWDMVSFAAGARGLFRLRWRPLLDGPLFGAFGAYGLDGARTDRSAMVARIGHWLRDGARDALLHSRPVRGDLAILVAPETQLFTYAQQGATAPYARALEGAYRGFFDNNIQADWVRLDDLDEYELVYLPYPVMLEERTVRELAAWVERGGTLIAEGCPAYFGDGGRVGEAQPNFGLDALFGAREAYVEFTPDLLGDLTLTVGGQRTRGGAYLQAYAPTTGAPLGAYADGRVAAVEHAYGRGRTLLIGTCPGLGHGAHPADGCREFFAWTLRWAGREPHLRTTEPRVTARLHDGPGGPFLWLTNPTRAALPVRLELAPSWGPFGGATALWGAAEARVDRRGVSLTVPARDAAILRLEAAQEGRSDDRAAAR